MKKALFISCALAVAGARAATMASQPWTTNRIAEAESRLNQRITSATNAIPVTVLPQHWPLCAVTNADGTTVNSQNFDGVNVAGVSATASDAWQVATDALGGLSGVAQSATNYTDVATNAMGAAFLQRQYSDGDGEATVGFDYGPGGLAFVPSELYAPAAYIESFWIISDDERGPLSAIGQYSGGWKNAREEVEEAIREKSLGGIWDQELGVWWTPHMKNGAYYWTATTNVNLAVEGNE